MNELPLWQFILLLIAVSLAGGLGGIAIALGIEHFSNKHKNL